MLRRSYLRGLIAVVIQALVNLPSPASPALFGTICDRTIYGIPDYRACQELLFGTAAARSGGIFNIDDFEHGFLLPFFGRRSQFTDWQWRHRVTLPLVWRTRRSAFFLSYDITDLRNTFAGKVMVKIGCRRVQCGLVSQHQSGRRIFHR